jgi:hypothetical protein
VGRIARWAGDIGEEDVLASYSDDVDIDRIASGDAVCTS